MQHFKAKMHEIQFRLGLHKRLCILGPHGAIEICYYYYYYYKFEKSVVDASVSIHHNATAIPFSFNFSLSIYGNA